MTLTLEHAGPLLKMSPAGVCPLSPLHAGDIMRIEALLRAGEDVHIRGDGLY